MTSLIVISSIILALFGILIVVWSIIDTRKRHYDDYMERKRND